MIFYHVIVTKPSTGDIKGYHVLGETADDAFDKAFNALIDSCGSADGWVIHEPTFDKDHGFSFANRWAIEDKTAPSYQPE